MILSRRMRRSYRACDGCTPLRSPSRLSLMLPTLPVIRSFSRAPLRRLPLALAAILCLFVLAGCGASASAGPLVAARVNSDGISLTDYQAMLAWDEASAALPDSSGQP